MECHSKWNVTQNGMSLQMECRLQWNCNLNLSTYAAVLTVLTVLTVVTVVTVLTQFFSGMIKKKKNVFLYVYFLLQKCDQTKKKRLIVTKS